MRQLLGIIRAPFLLLTPVCVLLGVSVAVYQGSALNWTALVVALTAALAAHISVNALNEYADYRSGLDRQTRKTPFSGGSGTLVDNPGYAPTARRVGFGALGVCMAGGLYLVVTTGWGLLPPGLLGALIVVGYTPWLNRYPLLCLLAPGVAFGPVMVMGTAYVLTGRYTAVAFAVSLLPLFAVSNLLLLNQFPDVEPDRRAGRRHLPILIGRAASVKVFALFWLLAYATVAASITAGLIPATAWLVLLGAPLAVLVIAGVRCCADRVGALIPWMGINTGIVLLSPLLLAGGLWLG